MAGHHPLVLLRALTRDLLQETEQYRLKFCSLYDGS
jgi:hypothetical protein